MRFAGVAVLTLLFAAPAWAQTPAKPPAKPKPAAAAPQAANPVAASYASMSDADRIAIQNDLVWTGDFNGLATAEFGARAITAVKAFQKRLKNKETGVLNPKERQQLSAAARAKRDALGWRIVEDAATGSRLGIPSKLTPQQVIIPGGTRWHSAQSETVIETFRVAAPDSSLAGVYEAQRKIADSKITYNVMRGDFFVISGTRGTKKLYVRGQNRGSEVRGFSILYDPALEGSLDPAVIAMSSTFQAFPATPVANVPPPRRKVEYGSGVLVDADGHVLTSRDLIDGCQTFTIANFGPADRIADDKERGLALLRVYGVRDLKPIALADAAGTSGTLVGVADPDRQSGGGNVSTLPLRFVAGASARPALEPTPGLGFAGAPVVDPTGRLTGVADVSTVAMAGAGTGTPATLIALGAVKGFLTEQKIALSTAAQSDARAAAVRVICVRK